jgi:hypothetical protein
MRSRMMRISLMLLVLFGLMATVARSVGATVPPERLPLDLGAIPLLPGEIEAVGLEDYGTDYGWLRTTEETVGAAAVEFGVPAAEVESTLVDEAGLTRFYAVRTARPVERGDPDTVATAMVYTSIFEFAGAKGAAAGEEYLAGISSPPGSETIADAREFGDASRIVHYTTLDPESDDSVDGIKLIVRTDTLVVDLDVQDIVRPGEKADPPRLAQVEALGERLMERIEAVRAGELPDLGSRMARIGVEGEHVFFSADRYEVQNGRVVRSFNFPPERYERDQAKIDAAGLTNRYIVNQDMALLDDWMKAPGTLTQVEQFAGDEEARSWFAGAQGRVVHWGFLQAIARAEATPHLGDEAIAFAITIDWGGGPLSGYALIVRSGQEIIEVWTFAPDGVSLETAIELAEIQLNCLHGSNCPERVPVPAELRAT